MPGRVRSLQHPVAPLARVVGVSRVAARARYPVFPVQARLRLFMWSTCNYALSMSKMIQIRNVPDGVHATLKARAALAGQPLTEFLLAEIRRVAERPSAEELAARLVRRSGVRLTTSPAKAVRAERDRR